MATTSSKARRARMEGGSTPGSQIRAGGRQPDGKSARSRGDARKRILAAAIDLFANQSFDTVSTTDIARVAESSQSVVLYHFQTKENLWKEAMKLLFANVNIRTLVDEAIYKDLGPHDRFKILLRRFVATSARYPQLGRVIFREGLNGGERLEWLLSDVAGEQYGAFIAVIEELQRGELLRDWNPVMLMLMIQTAGATLFNLEPLSRALMEEDPMTHEVVQRQADMLVAAMFEGLVLPAGN